MNTDGTLGSRRRATQQHAELVAQQASAARSLDAAVTAQAVLVLLVLRIEKDEEVLPGVVHARPGAALRLGGPHQMLGTVPGM